MNEVIFKLALQAMDFHGAIDIDSELKMTNSELQEFAELIIKEYEKFLPENCPWVKAEEKGPMKGWHVAFVARKHFGVKE
jgi:hypothetical protein